MGQVIQMFDWKRDRDLQTPIGKLLVEYGSTQRAKIEREVSRETCMCFFRDRYGGWMCEECPANTEEPA